MTQNFANLAPCLAFFSCACFIIISIYYEKLHTTKLCKKIFFCELPALSTVSAPKIEIGETANMPLPWLASTLKILDAKALTGLLKCGDGNDCIVDDSKIYYNNVVFIV